MNSENCLMRRIRMWSWRSGRSTTPGPSRAFKLSAGCVDGVRAERCVLLLRDRRRHDDVYAPRVCGYFYRRAEETRGVFCARVAATGKMVPAGSGVDEVLGGGERIRTGGRVFEALGKQGRRPAGV